jgi:ABC-2 type transport system permease protein
VSAPSISPAGTGRAKADRSRTAAARTGWAFLRAGFRRYSAYRLAALGGTITNTLFGVVKASIALAAIASAGGFIAGYDAEQTANNAWFTQALVATVGLFGWNELAVRIRSGDIAVDLARPVDLQLSWLAADLGRAAFMLLPRGLPPVLVGMVFFGVTLPDRLAGYLLAPISVALAVAVSFAGRFLVSLAAFWITELRGVMTLYMVSSNVLCGLILPVPWFPGWLQAVAAATPFPSMLQTPVDVVSGRVVGWDAVESVAVQVLWLAATLGVGRVVLARATRKLVVQGG